MAHDGRVRTRRICRGPPSHDIPGSGAEELARYIDEGRMRIGSRRQDQRQSTSPKYSTELSKFVNVGSSPRESRCRAHHLRHRIRSRRSPARIPEVSQRGHQRREADGRGQVPPSRWRQLSGARRSATCASPGSVHALDSRSRPQARREVHKCPPARLANWIDAAEGRGSAI